jgi:hypothetical protein
LGLILRVFVTAASVGERESGKKVLESGEVDGGFEMLPKNWTGS